jgi:hypothetical protein
VTAPRLPGALQPTVTQAAFLRVVAAPPEELEERWRALQPLDLDRVEPGVLALLPLVYLRLLDAHVEDPLLPRLKGAYRNVWYRNQLQLQRLSHVIDGRTDPIFIRDVALATAYYPHLGLRLIRRIDVLTVEGPRYLAGPLLRARLFEAFAERSEERLIGGRTVRTLAPGDELLVACAAGAAPRVDPSPDWLLDVRQILSTCRLAEPDRIAADARSLGLAAQLRDSVAYLAFADAALDVRDLLAALDARPGSRRDRFAYRVSSAPVGRLGFFPRTLGAYLRQHRSESLVGAALAFPRYLAEEWGVTPDRVALVFARKAVKTLAAGIRRGSA